MMDISKSRNTPLVEQPLLNIAAISSSTQTLGPGVRAVIWVQGCPLNCPGCIAPGWIPFRAATAIRPSEILEKIDLESLDGLTFSGGEPMEQAGGLAIVAGLARKYKPLNLICFTGYRYERLLSHPPNPGVGELLKEVDVLIDGPYIESKNDSIGLRGSSNQRIIHLTNRLKHHNLELLTRNVEVTIRDGEFSIVGIPTPEIKSAFDRAELEFAERRLINERL